MENPFFTYTDAELLSLLAQSDDMAFAEIYRRYWEKLLYVADTKLRDFAIAEELVQDIFFDIWNRRQELNITGTLEAYLAVSMKYKVINAQVKLKRAAQYQQEMKAILPSQQNATEDWYQFQELRQRLAKLVSALPERCRVTYQLNREQGLSQKEIAKALNITEKAVEANLARAVKSIRSGLSNLFSFWSLF